MKREIHIISAALGLILTCLSGCGWEGIHKANPKTKLRVNPSTGVVEYENNKDVDTSIKDSSFKDKAGREVKIGELVIRDNASDVRKADGQYQMPGLALQSQVNWQGGTQFTQAFMGGLADVVSRLTPLQAATMLGKMPKAQSIATPWGSLTTNVGLTDDQTKFLMQIAGSQLPGMKSAETLPSP